MSAIDQESAVRVAVAPDRSTAELIVPPAMDRSTLTIEGCEGLLRQAGVEVTDAVRQTVAELLGREAPAGQAIDAVVARATPAVHGCDGYVEWLVDAPAESVKDGGSESYYDVSAFLMVEAGQRIGRLHWPTDGREGRDVTGKVLAARQGKECRFKLDESISCEADGALVARDSGVLTRSESSALIRQVLEVPDYVDFSTGNIDFHGDVIVSKGVRDLFSVKATGNVEVAGLIEAATIIAGRDIVASGGFAGRERGTARCGGDLRAKYLDNVHAEIARDLSVEREIISCDLTVHGSVAAPHGAIIGGRMVVVGKMEVGMLGSGANVPTEVVVGSVPQLESLRQRLRGLIEKVESRRQDLVSRLEQLSKLTAGHSTGESARPKAEVSVELGRVERLLSKAGPALMKLDERIAARRTIDVFIERKLFCGVVVVVGSDRYHIHTDVAGPLRLCRDGSAAMVFQRPDGSGGPLARIADCKIEDTAVSA